MARRCRIVSADESRKLGALDIVRAWRPDSPLVFGPARQFDSRHYGMADRPHLARRQISRDRMVPLESHWLGGQCSLHLALLCPMVGHRTTQTSGSAQRVLVAQPFWIRLPVALRILQAGLRLHFRLSLHVDS